MEQQHMKTLSLMFPHHLSLSFQLWIKLNIYGGLHKQDDVKQLWQDFPEYNLYIVRISKWTFQSRCYFCEIQNLKHGPDANNIF